MDLNLFDSLIRVLMVAVVLVVLSQRLNFPAIIAYIVVGVMVGPHALGWVPDTEDTYALADFGVVFLMFTIGLEFSLTRVWRMKHLVFGLGGAQVLATLLVTSLIGYWLGMSWQQAITVATIISVSSTAIVSKQLQDQNELNTPHGNNAIAILLFQDLAVVPFFVVVSSFISHTNVLHIAIGMTIAKAIILVLALLVIGRGILRPLFREIAATESLELFTLSVLLVTLTAAWLTHRFGLSLALGAFMAGMMLGETEFRHQIEATIRPFRDILLALFFITVGMLFNMNAILMIWPWVLLLLTAVTLLKIIIVASVSYYYEKNVSLAARTGLIMAQGSEFGFALLSLAMMGNLLPELYGQVVLGALIFSMAIAPVLIRWNDEIIKKIVPKKYQKEIILPEKTAHLFTKGLNQHVILCGFSRVGQNVGKMLDDEGISYIAIDADHELVINSQAAGCPVILGDAALYEILHACKIRQATALVITFDHMPTAVKILTQIGAHNLKLNIFVRTKDDTELERLQALGATEVVPDSLESSITLASHLLIAMNVPATKVSHLMNQIRKNRYRLLRDIIPGEE